MTIRFDYNQRGGLTLDRDSLHASEGYKRQVEALKQLPERKAVMGEKTFEQSVFDVLYEMRLAPRHQLEEAARRVAHLTQPAQAVDAGAAAEVWHCAHCDISDIARNATDERIKRRAERVKSWMERNRPATLPGDNGEEG